MTVLTAEHRRTVRWAAGMLLLSLQQSGPEGDPGEAATLQRVQRKLSGALGGTLTPEEAQVAASALVGAVAYQTAAGRMPELPTLEDMPTLAQLKDARDACLRLTRPQA